MDNQIIAISGLKGSGKSLAADYLSMRLDLEIRPLAQPIKEICAFLFDLNEEQLDGSKKEVQIPELGASPRQLMQAVGTELFQDALGKIFLQAAKDFWVRQLLKGYSGEGLVIPDMRFPHEEQALRDRFPQLLAIRIERPAKVSLDAHRSETSGAALTPDITIKNTGSIEEFLETLEHKIVQQLARKAS